MLEFVCRNRQVIVITVLISLVFERAYCRSVGNTKRDGVDVFDLLLGLYKINPLKSSKVYTKFANNVLTQSDKNNFNTIASSNENRSIQKVSFQQIKDIEKNIHPLDKKQFRHSVETPGFDVENVDIENFNVDVIVKDQSKGFKYDTKNALDGIDIARNENNARNYAPNVKDLPGNQWLLPNTIKHNPAPMRQWFSEFKEHRNGEGYKGVKYDTKNTLDGIDIDRNENNARNYAPNVKDLPGNQWLLLNTIKHNPAPMRQWFSEFKEHRYGEGYKGVKNDTKNTLDGIDIARNENNARNYAPNVKDLPGNQWLLPNTIKHNPAPMRQGFSEFKEHRYGEGYNQVPNSFPVPQIISDNELNPEIVVL